MSTPKAIALVAALLLALVVPAGTGAALAAASVQVTPLAGPAGTDFEFFVGGFFDEEQASYWLTGPTGLVYPGTEVVTTDDDGNVKITYRVPSHVITGRYFVTVYGLLSNREVIGSFEVLPPPPSLFVNLVASPATGPRGTTFRLDTSGFSDGETIVFWVTAPDHSVNYGGELSCRSDGSTSFTWSAGYSFQAGTYYITVYGLWSDRLGIVPVQVT